ELAPEQAVALVLELVGKIELRGQYPPAGRLHLHVDMPGAAGIQRRQDRLQAIAALGIAELVPAIAETAVVVVAVFIGVPEIEQRIPRRLAIGRQHAAAHHQARRLGRGLDERDALRACRLEERSFGLTRRWLAADLGPRAARERKQQCRADEAAAI